MKKLIGALSVVIALLVPANSFSECLPKAQKADPHPVLSKWGISKCIGKINDEMKVGDDRTVTVKLAANQTYFFTASGCARVELIYIAAFGEEGVILKSDIGIRPTFCFKTGNAGNYTFLLTLEKTEPIVKKSNVSACVTLSECKE